MPDADRMRIANAIMAMISRAWVRRSSVTSVTSFISRTRPLSCSGCIMSTFIQKSGRLEQGRGVAGWSAHDASRPSVGGTLTDRTTMPRRKAPGVQIVAADTALFLTLSEQVAQRIADEILNERFASGARLK